MSTTRYIRCGFAPAVAGLLSFSPAAVSQNNLAEDKFLMPACLTAREFEAEFDPNRAERAAAYQFGFDPADWKIFSEACRGLLGKFAEIGRGARAEGAASLAADRIAEYDARGARALKECRSSLRRQLSSEGLSKLEDHLDRLKSGTTGKRMGADGVKDANE